MHDAEDRLSVQFAALADPTRRDVLRQLRRGSASVSELCGRYAMSRPAVSQHITVLERAGLVTRVRRGRRIDCQLTPEALDPAARWIEAQRAEWDDRLDRLDAHLRQHLPTQQPHDRGASS